MIHYAFHFCDAVEKSQDVDESLIDATKRIASIMDLNTLLKVRDSFHEIADRLEAIATLKS